MKKLFLALLILVCLQQVSAYTYGNNFTATVLSTTEGLTNTTVQWATCFKATDSTNITKVNLFVTKVSTTNQCSNVTLQGGNALGQPNGTVLSTGGFCIASGTGWVTANMQGTGYRVGAGTTYCAVVKANGTGTTSTTNYVRLGIWTTPYQNFTALNLYANSSWNRFYFDTSWKQQNQSPVVVFTYNDSRTQLGNGYDSASLQLIYGSRWIAENFTLNTSQQLWNFTARISKNTSTTPPDNLRMQINWANGSVVVANFTFLSNATVTTTATAYTAAMPNNPVLPAGRYQAVLLSPARSAIGGAAYQWSGFTGNTFSNATWNGTTSFMQSTTDNGSNWVSSTSTDMFFFFNSTDFEFIAPNVTQLIPAPQANRTTAAVNLSCRASDNNNLTKIELFGNFTGAWAINATNSTPINNSITNFNLTGIADGVYLWNCRATDAQGLATFNSTNATFIVDSIPPSPVLTTPSNNTIIGGLVSLQANSPDNLVGTKNVTYQYQNSTRSWTTIGTSTAGTPWSITLNTTALTDGLYQIRIQSWDNFGNLNTTTNYTITIDNGLPSVFNVQVIYRCAYDSTDGLCDDSGTETFLDFTPPNRGNPLSNVTIRVNASDNTGIRNVTLNGSAYGLGIFNMTRISGNSQTTTTAGCYDGMSLSCDYAQSCTGSPMSDCENNGNTCSQVLCPITVTANALYEVNLTTPVVADGFYNFRITAIDISTPANKNNATNPQVEVWNQSARWNNVKQYTCTSADNTVTPPVCLVRVEVPIGNTVTTADNVSFSVDWTQSRTGLCLNMSIASWNLTTTFVNDTPVAFDDNWEFSPSCTTFKRVYADKVSLTVADRNISFKMYGNSSILGNLNVTDTYVFTVVGRTPSIAINPDTSLPIIFDNWSDCYVAQTCRQVRAGDGVLFSAKWFADQAMNYSIFSRANGTGFINDTLSTVPASNWSNFTTNPLSMGAVFTWQIWVNDSRGRMGVSAQQTLTPIPSNIQFPILSTNQTFLGSQVNFSWTYLSNYNITSYIFSFNNGSGVFVNDSTVNVGNAQRVEDDMFPFGITFNESNYVIKGINNTFNSTVQWTVYLFDQYGGVFNSSIQSFQTNYPFPLVTAINNPPSNHSNLSTNNFTFNFTVFIGNDINNISIFSNSSGTWGRNATNSTPLNESELQLVTVNNLPQAKRFIWNVQA